VSRLLLVGVSLLAYGLNVFGYPLPTPRVIQPVVADVQEEVAEEPATCSCCCGTACPGGGKCCCNPHEEPQPQPPKPPAKPTDLTWVIGMKALACRGEATVWVTQGAALPPPLVVTWQYEWTPQGETTSPTLSLDSIVLDRTTPPPRHF
jgi:hypothetical protein